MPIRPAIQRFALVLCTALFAEAHAGCLGCAAGTEPAPTDVDAPALRRAFPEQASHVLDAGDPLVTIDDGFAAAPVSCAKTLDGVVAKIPASSAKARVESSLCAADHGGLKAIFPARAEAPVRFQLPREAEIRVRERGLVGDGSPLPAARAIGYARDGGASYWTASAGGYEEWLHLEAGAAQSGLAAAVWDIEGGSPTQQGDAIVIADAEGAPRVVVTAPRAFAEGGRAIATKLIATATSIELFVEPVDGAVLIDPMWTLTGSMSTGRIFPALAVLQDGRVLAAGGFSTTHTAAAEIYDPATQFWSPAAPMANARAGHTATTLANGKVLVAGGYNGTTTLGAEVYDPVTNTWSSTGAMISNVTVHTATLLQNGKVLVAGGQDGTVACTPVAQLYDPATNTWSATASLGTGRCLHAASILANGRVFISAGSALTGLGQLVSNEFYNPATNTFSGAANMPASRAGHTSTTLQSNKVLVTGGGNDFSGGTLSSAALYDSVANTWTPIAPMSSIREFHTATLLPSGQVLVTGGDSNGNAVASSDVLDPATNTWSNGGSMIQARELLGATLLSNGKVLAVGGSTTPTGTGLATTELWSLGAAANGSACGVAGDCASGFCVDGFCCNAACNAGACDACSVAAGGSVNGVCALLSGNSCNDNNGCSQTDVCQSGVCTGTNPVQCPMPDQCHTQGVCSPATGMCSTPIKVNGSACNDSNACTQSDTCQAGVCTGGAPVMCMPLDTCHIAGTCDGATGMCSNPAKADGTACNDNNACSMVDTCQLGVCVGASPVMCAPLDSCHDLGVCNPNTGACSNPSKNDGAACDDKNACSQGDTCQAGVCSAGAPVVCPPPDACHDLGACNPVNGVCSYPMKADGAACDDANPCTESDACTAGVCGGSALMCTAIDECHLAGTCDKSSGACTNPVLPDGTPCKGGACKGGVCESASGAGGGGGGGVGGDASGGGNVTSGDGGSGGNGGNGGDDGDGGDGGRTVRHPSGCGCGVSESPTGGIYGAAMALLFLARRRRRPTKAA